MTRPILTDWHAHLFPEELVEALERRDVEPLLRRLEGGRALHARAGGEPMKPSESLYSVSRRLAELDRASIDVQVLSVPGLMGVDSVDDDGVFDLVNCTNRGLERVVAAHPTRFRALASVPLREPARAADVLEHAVRDLGHIGAILPVDAFVDEEIAAVYRPIVERADRLTAHIFVHPGPLPGAGQGRAAHRRLDKLRYSVPGIQNSVTDAAITLEFSDYLDGLKNVRVHVANLGGNLAYLAGRWAHTEERLGGDAWDGRLRKIYVDTASLGSQAIAFAAQTFGADRLLFGTDAPIYTPDAAAAEARLTGLGLSDIRAAA